MIHQQHLHFNFHGGDSAAALSGTLSRWLREQLLPAMEQVLNELDIPSKRLRLNALQINAGEISGPDWEEQLTRSICRELRQLVREAAVWPAPLPDAMQETLRGSAPVYSEEERQQLVLHYLQTGALPWYASGMQPTVILQWLEQLIVAGYFSTTAGVLFLRGQAAAFRRLLMQSTSSVLERWMGQWQTDAYQRWFPAMLRIARQVMRNSSTTFAWAYALLYDCCTLTAHQQHTPLWQLWLADSRIVSSTVMTQLRESVQQLVGEQITPREWEVRFGDALDALPEKKTEEQTAAGPATANYYIGNAGLVLLHPFLPAWFSQQELCNDKGWVNEDAQRRAVLLLHYLATGQQEIAEYELPLCKLLTGYPMERPVEAILEVTPAEAQAAEILLQEVIAEWPILKSTSPEGLQQNFLKREGKLAPRDNGWLLQVEQQTFDILLEHLPWGIGIIKNSWMKELLFTEWF
jgi:hypothetical protein